MLHVVVAIGGYILDMVVGMGAYTFTYAEQAILRWQKNYAARTVQVRSP